jgi:hypothetical protein
MLIRLIDNTTRAMARDSDYEELGYLGLISLAYEAWDFTSRISSERSAFAGLSQ